MTSRHNIIDPFFVIMWRQEPPGDNGSYSTLDLVVLSYRLLRLWSIILRHIKPNVNFYARMNNSSFALTKN